VPKRDPMTAQPVEVAPDDEALIVTHDGWRLVRRVPHKTESGDYREELLARFTDPAHGEALRRHMAGLHQSLGEARADAVFQRNRADEHLEARQRLSAALAACKDTFALIEGLDITEEQFVGQGPGFALRQLRKAVAYARALKTKEPTGAK